MRYALLIGVFSGLAVLCKWLTGLLPYAVWGVGIAAAITPWRRSGTLAANSWLSLKHLAAALVLTTAIALPWQLYTHSAFPAEAADVVAQHVSHVGGVVEGHGGEWWFHLGRSHKLFGGVLWLFVPVGLYAFAKTKPDRMLTYGLLPAVFIVYLFFAAVATKMTAFVNPVVPIVWIVIASGAVFIWDRVKAHFGAFQKGVGIVALLALRMLDLSPGRLLKPSFGESRKWTTEQRHTKTYRALASRLPEGAVVFNCIDKGYIDLMFYSGAIAYPGRPTQAQIDMLKSHGREVFVFSDGSLPVPVELGEFEQLSYGSASE